MVPGADTFDLRHLPDGFYENPYPTYDRLRAEAPVLACPDGSYLLTRYDDVRRVYRDPRCFSSDKRVQFAPLFGEHTPLFAHHTTSLVFNDPPLHTRVRKAIGNALSDRLVLAMSPSLQALVDRLIDDIEARGAFDLVEHFAAAIPIEVIGNLLRVPLEERGPLRRWSLNILGALEVAVDRAALAEGNASVLEFLDYLEILIGRRRSTLADQDDDIVARLLRWRDADGVLARDVLYHQCIFLLNAGHETTTNLIANGVLALVDRPELIGRLRAEPALIDTAVEELLRFESPNQLGNRTTTEAVEIGGVRVPAQTVITLGLGAANRDPDVFPEPQELRLDRHPNPHLAFGAGIHTCAGLNVARLEGRIAIGRLLARLPGLVCTHAPVRARRARFRGFVSAPMTTGQ
jgi:cytochrome P450